MFVNTESFLGMLLDISLSANQIIFTNLPSRHWSMLCWLKVQIQHEEEYKEIGKNKQHKAKKIKNKTQNWKTTYKQNELGKKYD